MAERENERELACPGCGWSESVDTRAMTDRLRAVGMLRRQVRPDASEVIALLTVAAAKMACPDCGGVGLSVENAASTDSGDWAEAATCAACGKPIPVERMRALPSTRFCVACQDDEERGTANGEEDYCPRCGAVMELRPSRGAGLTRFVMACPSGCRQ